jgi:transposase InsO family protein
VGGRININISSVLNSSYVGANLWLLIQDDFTNFLWSYFLKAKSGLPETMVEWLRLVKKELSLNAKCICLDNSGENTAFHKLVQYKSEINIKFEFTAPGTPQQNGKVEQIFATLYGKT